MELKLLTVILIVACSNATYQLVQVEVVTVGLLYPPFVGSFVYNGAAVTSAVEELNRVYKGIFNITHTYLFDYKVRNCFDILQYSDFLVANWYNQGRKPSSMAAMISTGCTEYVGINRLATSWNIPIITSLASDPVMLDKTVSPNWVTVGPTSITNFAILFLNLVNFYHWTTLYVVIDDTATPGYHSIMNSFINIFRKIPGSQLTLVHVNSDRSSDFSKTLIEFSTLSRGSSGITEYDKWRIRTNGLQNRSKLLVELNLQVYTALEMFRYEVSGNYTWQYNDDNDTIAKEAFRSLLFINPGDGIYALPSKTVTEEWQERTVRMYNYTLRKDELPWPVPAATYSAFMVFGVVLNETIVSNPSFDLRNGKAFTKQFFNRTFMLNYTEIYMNGAGERINHLVVMDLNRATGNFQPALYQDAVSRKISTVTEMDWGGTAKNQIPLNKPVCGYTGKDAPCGANTTTTQGVAIGATLFSIVGVILVTFGIRKQFTRNGDNDRWWELHYERFQFVYEEHKFFVRPAFISPSKTDLGIETTRSLYKSGVHAPKCGRAHYDNEDVWTDRFRSRGNKTSSELLSSKALHILLKKFRTFSHANVNRFYGLTFTPLQEVILVSSFGERGSLHDLFDSSAFVTTESEHRLVLTMDLLKGMQFIHSSAFRVHGSLTGSKCLIDKRFTLKISQLGFDQLATILSSVAQTDNTDYVKQYWTAPELIRCQSDATKASDIFSVGIIMAEIATVIRPYETRTELSPAEIIKMVKKGGETPMRPTIDNETAATLPLGFVQIIRRCWDEVPEKRSTITEVFRAVGSVLGNYGRVGIVDKVLAHLDAYAETLEVEVIRKTEALILEARKCDAILKEILPKTIVEQLRRGNSVQPELFDCVTVMFCNVGGFDTFAAMETPINVINFLNVVYSMFDPVVAQCDAYKVETIGDVYMVASGVPVRNGREHVRVICSLSLALRKASTFTSNKSEMYFKAGIHTGTCAAGVIGKKNPRFCLFGDTVNTASRMGSYSLPNKIHTSEETVVLLREFSEFRIVKRGDVAIKGKSILTTYWIE